MDWLQKNLRDDEDVQIKSLTNDQTILIIAGPKARDVLSAVSRGDWSNEAFKFLAVKEAYIGIAPATVMRVSFSGETAYELHIPNASLYAAYLALREAGDAHGMKIFGAKAVDSMRMEMGYLHWKADILTEFDPFETNLGRFIKMDKPDFVGKAALEKKGDPKYLLISMALDSTDSAAHGGASVMKDGKVIGTVTSGDWGYRTGLNLAYAFVDPAFTEPDTTFEVDVLGTMVPAKVIPAGPYFADSSR
jgi:dimethylglycine dehydrogenase